MPARSDVTHRTTLSGWVFRAVISAHMAAIVGQPVFAGVYLSGDYDSLRRHAVGADIVTSIGYLQVIVAIVVWVRLRQARPFLATLALVAAETVQYFAGLNGALWLHPAGGDDRRRARRAVHRRVAQARPAARTGQNHAEA
ncbi:hypothetical protein [Nonomuraea basaltis]|uniref:hypothetical protein n=1 Tax=Nonomuraea basaltis TaxID=2495887 RepID=UPI0019803DBB|nr:hypothetical protein [Nonomuraea basaltis]